MVPRNSTPCTRSFLFFFFFVFRFWPYRCFFFVIVRIFCSFSQEMSDFYEQALVTAGVAIEKDVTGQRLWGLEEQVRGVTRRAHRRASPRRAVHPNFFLCSCFDLFSILVNALRTALVFWGILLGISAGHCFSVVQGFRWMLVLRECFFYVFVAAFLLWRVPVSIFFVRFCLCESVVAWVSGFYSVFFLRSRVLMPREPRVKLTHDTKSERGSVHEPSFVFTNLLENFEQNKIVVPTVNNAYAAVVGPQPPYAPTVLTLTGRGAHILFD